MKVSRLKELVLYIVAKTGPVSRLKLAKLIYLIDWAFYRKHGLPLTKAYYMRERRGPVPATFGTELDEMTGFEVEIKRGQVAPGRKKRFSPHFTEREQDVIEAMLKKYQLRSERDLLLVTYLSAPMKAVLKEERTGATRTHEGISFHRFPSNVQRATPLHEDIQDRDFQEISPEQMTDEDTAAIIVAFQQALPLMLTAHELIQQDSDS